MPIITRLCGIRFDLEVCGFGFGFQLGGYDPLRQLLIILSWHIIKNHSVWRSETHSRMDGYHYRCVKNGKVVEDLSFRSPVVNNA